MSLASEILARSPHAYWKLDETSGTTGADSSGNGNDLALGGTFTLAAVAAGARGNAVAFDGSSGYAETTKTTDEWLFTNWTLYGWFYFASIPSGDNAHCMMTLTFPGTGPLNMAMGINLDGPSAGHASKFTGGLFNGGWKLAVDASALSTGWHEWIVKWSGSTATLYIDGSQVASNNTGSGPDHPTANPKMRIARRWDSSGSEQFLACKAQHVAVFPSALSDADRAAIRAAALAELLGSAAETETANPLSGLKRFALGVAVETDTAAGLVTGSHVVGPAGEADTAVGLLGSKILILGAAAETELAVGLDNEQRIILGTANETNRAHGLGTVAVSADGTMQWVAFDLQSGDFLMNLPGLLVDYPIRRTLGQYESATARFIVEDTSGGVSFPFTHGPSPDPSVDWWYATIPGACLLACYQDNDVNKTIQWAGFVTLRTRTGENNEVQLSLATTEAYLLRRFINADVTYTATGQNAVMRDIAENHVQDGATAGLPLTIVTDGDGPSIDQQYKDADLVSVYEAFDALAALSNGPEWELRWSWRADMSGLECALYVAEQLGSTGSPAAVFTMPGNITSVTYTEDYTENKGANGVRAYSTRPGITPSSFEIVVDDYGRPRFNFQMQAPDVITSTAKLNRYAQRALARLNNGSKSVQIVADRRTSPVFCRDWQLGDVIGYEVGNTDDGQDFIPVFPFTFGLTGTQRVIAVEIAEDTITPIATVGDA